jgi:hypothetical protein
MEPRVKETEQLARLERIAQRTENPKVIEKQAERPQEKFQFQLNKTEVWWLIGFALAAALFFGLQTLLNFKASLSKRNSKRGCIIISKAAR